mgnify:FL=1
MSFEKIIGNNKIKNELIKAFRTNSIAHSYIFSGQYGIGKKQIAIEFAKMILCLNKDNAPCGECKSCLELENDNNPDFNIIKPDGKIKIDQIRQMLEKVYEKPIISDKKVYIIDDAETMTVEAQNCLLKTLEEPPEYIVIILITSNESNLINTIKSRCLKLTFNPLENSEIKQYLEKYLDFQNVSETMLEIFEGSIGKALKVKEKQELYNNIETTLNNFSCESVIELINNATEIYKGKENINEILEYFNIYFLKKAKEEYNNASKYVKAIEIVEDTKKRLVYNSNYDMTIDNLLINIWEELNSWKQ